MSTVGDLRKIIEGKDDAQDIHMNITGINVVVMDLPGEEVATEVLPEAPVEAPVGEAKAE